MKPPLPIKTASQLPPELLYALMGAGGGGVLQGLRRLFQSREDRERNGAPSILNGMLAGGTLGAGAGFGGRALQALMATPGMASSLQSAPVPQSGAPIPVPQLPAPAVGTVQKAPTLAPSASPVLDALTRPMAASAPQQASPMAQLASDTAVGVANTQRAVQRKMAEIAARAAQAAAAARNAVQAVPGVAASAAATAQGGLKQMQELPGEALRGALKGLFGSQVQPAPAPAPQPPAPPPGTLAHPLGL